MGGECKKTGRSRLWGPGLGLALWCAGLVGVAGATDPITEFPLPAGSPSGITAGPDGALWFTWSTVYTVNAGTCTCPDWVSDCTYILIACRNRNTVYVNKIGRITTDRSITEFPLPSPNSAPRSLTSGPDGALWFTLDHKIGRITTDGSITEFPLPTPGHYPGAITAGPDGALWFTLRSPNKIGRITRAGTITEFSLPTDDYYPIDITAGPDGALWFTENLVNDNRYIAKTIGRITTDGSITEFPLPDYYDVPARITAGPDGALWFTALNHIGRITTAGTVTGFRLPGGLNYPGAITAGPDGALWFTDNFGSSIGNIGRITTTGAIFQVPLPTADGIPSSITAGSDGALWFTVGGKIGRITPDVVGIAAVSLSESALCTGRTISYQATLTPGPKLTPVDIYLGAVLPDGVTFLSLVQGSPGVISTALGPSPIPFQANVPLTQSVVSFSYTFEGFEPAGTYSTYARLAIAGSNPLLPENELDLAVQSFQFTSGVVLSLSVDAGGSVTRSPAGTHCGPGGYAFAPGTRVTLTAESDFLWFVKDDFLGWGGDCAAVGRRDSRVHGTCTLVMTTNKSVSASFDCPICHMWW